MKIIGGHDYYDGVQMYGHDHHLVFIRDTSVQEEKSPCSLCIVDGIDQAFILFCGVMYCAYRVRHPKYSYYGSDCSTYSWEYGKEGLNLAIDGNRSNPLTIRRNINFDDNKRQLKESLSQHLSDKFKDYCIDNRIVVAIIIKQGLWDGKSFWAISKNVANLKEYEFYKAVPAFQAYQEIERFLGNDLALNVKPPVVVEEKVRLAKRGFDPKESFRKPKTKH